MSRGPRLGACVLDDGRTGFRVWAPDHREVDLVLGDERIVPLHGEHDGYFGAVVRDAPPGTRYRFRLDGSLLPDPASRHQPDGVHGPSAVVDPIYPWTDATWRPPPLSRWVLYELHVGTFTPAGTFAAAIDRLPALADLGVTAVELLPIAQFPGGRNWGYDGVAPFAAQSTYGGPDGLRAFVDAAHATGLAVVLDVVYNHLGPEGNHLARWGPYFTGAYRTPWGDALNFAGRGSDEVRHFFIESARWWVVDCHVDGLRLDAVHAIVDPSPVPFVQELAASVRAAAAAAGRTVTVIAESAANDPRTVRSVDAGGLGLDAQWSDDFHHALHALLTGERSGYYEDFGSVHDLARAYTDGFVYEGRYSPFRGRRHGAPTGALPGQRFVVFAQNHDQIGNRAGGERLSVLVSPEALRLAAAAVLLAPFVPLLFMGEEDGVTAPFPYFVSHSDADLVDAVRHGRAEEFAAFTPAEGNEPPDPQSEATFRSAIVTPRDESPVPSLRAWYRHLLRLRREEPALAALDRDAVVTTVHEPERALVVMRDHPHHPVAVVLNFGHDSAWVALPDRGTWSVLADSEVAPWGLGPGASVDPPFVTVAPHGALVLRRSEP